MSTCGGKSRKFKLIPKLKSSYGEFVEVVCNMYGIQTDKREF